MNETAKEPPRRALDGGNRVHIRQANRVILFGLMASPGEDG